MKLKYELNFVNQILPLLLETEDISGHSFLIYSFALGYYDKLYDYL